MDAVERHVTLPTDLDRAWELLTRPEDLAAWLGDEVVLDPTPGAAGLVVERDGTARHLVVDEVEVGRRLAWRWSADGEDETRVEVTLTPGEDGTRVRVVERVVEQVASASASAAQASTSAAVRSDAWSHRLLHLEALLLVAAAVRG